MTLLARGSVITKYDDTYPYRKFLKMYELLLEFVWATVSALSALFIQWAIAPVVFNGKWSEMSPERKRAQYTAGFSAAWVTFFILSIVQPDRLPIHKYALSMLAGYFGVGVLEFWRKVFYGGK